MYSRFQEESATFKFEKWGFCQSGNQDKKDHNISLINLACLGVSPVQLFHRGVHPGSELYAIWQVLKL
jgi:hypothetical protein